MPENKILEQSPRLALLPLCLKDADIIGTKDTFRMSSAVVRGLDLPDHNLHPINVFSNARAQPCKLSSP